MSQEYTIAVLPGDGIGPEVIAEAVKVMRVVESRLGLKLNLKEMPVGGAGYEASGHPLPDDTLKAAKSADAVLLGAVGGPKWESIDFSLRPERALLGLRSELGLFANLRPAKVFRALIGASTLKREVVEGLDLLVVRELTGGIYFGQPRGVDRQNGQRRGVNTLVYTESEIRRIAEIAFDVARKRNNKVCSVDKANVLEATGLWREVVTEVHKEEFSDVELSHMYVDNAAMQLVRNPKQFDVILTTNMFGDILSDEASMLTGSIGMLPSASLGGKTAMYEPIHGSAPDIAGQDMANPLATILSVGMMFKYSLEREDVNTALENVVESILDEGYRTKDIMSKEMKEIGCQAMGDLVIEALEKKLSA